MSSMTPLEREMLEALKALIALMEADDPFDREHVAEFKACMDNARNVITLVEVLKP